MNKTKPTMSFKLKVVVSLLLLIFSFLIVQSYTKPHIYANLNVVELITIYGYTAETHNIITEDGYIITLHRVTSKNATKFRKPSPILLYHGLLNSAAEFVSTGPGNALGLILADQNYDVWLGNYRGTTWSRKHTKLDPDHDKEYWNFTLRELGKYDIPASIDHILKTTETDIINFVGFSQSAPIFFIAMLEQPEYVKKIKLASLMAPAFPISYTNSLGISLSAKFDVFLRDVLYPRGLYELFPANALLSRFFKAVCVNKNSIIFVFCEIFFYFSQGDYGTIDLNKISIIMTNLPAGVGTLQYIHCLQVHNTGKLSEFNWGKDKNLIYYGQEQPPDYNLTAMTVPVALYYSQNDQTVVIENSKELIRILPNIVKTQFIHENFNHLDFILGANVTEILYKQLIDDLNKY